MSRFEPTDVDFQDISKVRSADTIVFSNLVHLAKLDPASDICFSDLDGVDFSGSDLRGFNFTGCTVVGANWNNCIIDETTTLPEMESGAIHSLVAGANLRGQSQNTAKSVAVFLVDTLSRDRFLPAAKSIHPLELTASFEPVLLNLLREAASIAPQKIYIMVDDATRSLLRFLRGDNALEAALRREAKGALLEVIHEIELFSKNVQIVEKRKRGGLNSAYFDAIEFFVKDLSASHLLLIDPQYVHIPTEYSLNSAFSGWLSGAFEGALLQPSTDHTEKISRFMISRGGAGRLLETYNQDTQNLSKEHFLDILLREFAPEEVRYLEPQRNYRFAKAADTVTLGVALSIDSAELSQEFTDFLDDLSDFRKMNSVS